MNPRYEHDPILYAKEVLKLDFVWDEIAAIAKALQTFPHKAIVKSGHGIGKSFFSAMMINWFFDTFNPSTVISTAPSDRALKKVLWKHVRLQRMRAGLPDNFIGPTAAEMATGPDHIAMGMTTSKGGAFQGHHDKRMFFVFDEATDIDPLFWTIVSGMFKPEQGHMWLAILNPTSTSSPAYMQERAGGWHVFSLSCLRHPNIINQLEDKPPVIPEAVTISQIDQWVREFCMPISDEEKVATDIEWPRLPHKIGCWYRPGPEFESRCMGQWPSKGSTTIWSDAMWNAICEMEAPPPPINMLPELGCDAAREGQDNTDVHTRWGCRSLSHVSMHGWTETAICGYLIETAREWVAKINQEREARNMAPLDYHHVPIKVDDDGTGGAICSMLIAEKMNAIPVRSGKNASSPERYPNKRSELWFQTVEKAKQGLVSLGKLDADTLYTLRTQAMAPLWWMDRAGRREVEPKKDTKDRLGGKSPDGMDALNLAYYEGGMWEAPTTLDHTHRTTKEYDHVYTQPQVGAYDRVHLRQRMQATGIGRRLFRR